MRYQKLETLEEFNQWIWDNDAVNCAEPRVEKDGAYEYHCFDNEEGEEIASVHYHRGEATYHVRVGINTKYA